MICSSELYINQRILVKSAL